MILDRLFQILSNKNSYPQIASIIESKMDKMVLTDQQIEDFNLICYKLETGSITLDTAVLKLSFKSVNATPETRR